MTRTAHLSPVASLAWALPLSLLLACGDKSEAVPAGGGDGGDACTEQTWYLDADADGYGGPESTLACEAPEGALATSTDCDDADASDHPDGIELCDGADNDCDGSVDEDATDATTAYTDADGDGFGDDASPVEICALEAGLSDVGGDCDDADPSAYPDGVELCDGVDNDCDGSTDGLSVPGDHATIEEAFAAAAAGDLICLDEGDYAESPNLEGKGVRLSGAGVGKTRIVGPAMATADVDRAVSLYEADGMEISGMTIRGLEVSNSEGVRLSEVELSGMSCTLSNCYGVGLYSDHSSLELEEVVLTDNLVTGSGSGTQNLQGLAFFYTSEVSWTGGGIVDNEVNYQASAIYGYGLLDVYESVLVGTDLDISGNIVEASAVTSSGGNINMNGLVYTNGSQLDLVDLRIANNDFTTTSAVTDGGSGASNAQSYGWVYISGGTLSWTGGGITDNVNTNTGGSSANAVAAFFTAESTELTDLDISGNIVWAWASDDTGSTGCTGVFVNNSLATLLRIDLRDNFLSCTGDGGAYNYGLAVFWNSSTALDNVIMAGNELESSDAVYGLLSFNYQDDTPSVVNSTIVGNTLFGARVKAGVLHASQSGMDLVNLAVTNNGSTATGDVDSSFPAAAVMDLEHGWPYTFTYSLHWGNSGTGASAYLSGGDDVGTDILGNNGNITADPAYASVSTIEAVGWDLSPGSGSGLVDAGDPSILDVDGSVSDIGATGGPEAAW